MAPAAPRPRPLRRLALALCLLLAPVLAAGHARAEVPEGARGSDAVQHGDPRVEASLLVDAQAVRPGEPVRVGVWYELDPGWHLYWRNPGESGLATALDWSGSDARVGALRWPAPEVFREADGLITTYGYAEDVLLQAEASFAGRAGDRARLRVETDFLVCKVQCIPGHIALQRDVPLANATQPAEAAQRALFDRFAARVPVPPERVGLAAEAFFSQSAIRPTDTFRAAVSLTCASGGAQACPALRPGTADPSEAFVPDAIDDVELRGTGARAHPFAEGLLLTLSGRASTESVASGARLRGVAKLEDEDGTPLLLEIDLPLPRATAGTAVTQIDNPWLEPDPSLASGALGVPLWRAFVLALLGGLILNLMPCVLPVLAIKVFGIAERAHAHRREVLQHGAAYTAGILATMAALAALVIGLREAGTAVGWGFQFQEPIFVAAISTVLVVFALNLFGVFEVGVTAGRLSEAGAQASGLRRSFFEGLLAVIVATPCSAPFLGTAVGFAFASSAPVILTIFLAIGLGLAAPFVAVTLVPGWARLIPRAGPWMLHLRAGLGFALLATVVWLLWIVGRAAGSEGQVLLVGFLLLVAFGAWLYGLLQRARADGRAPGAALLLAGLAALGLAWLPLHASTPQAATERGDDAFARRYDPQQIAAELAGGRAVFVYFTADWCLTCKVNERVVLHDARVAAELERLDIAAFVADWTLRDEGIRAELARHGRAGVPMYLVYDPRHPGQPRVLPELLTVDLLLDALRAAGHDLERTPNGGARPA